MMNQIACHGSRIMWATLAELVLVSFKIGNTVALTQLAVLEECDEMCILFCNGYEIVSDLRPGEDRGTPLRILLDYAVVFCMRAPVFVSGKNHCNGILLSHVWINTIYMY